MRTPPRLVARTLMVTFITVAVILTVAAMPAARDIAAPALAQLLGRQLV